MIEASTLLTGPRGRRMLLAFALESERASASDYEQWQFHRAVADASYELDPGRGTSRVRMRIGDGDGDPEGYPPTPTPEEVAELLDAVVLAEVTQALLRTALSQSVDSARYWQEPDGEDVLIGSDPVRSELLRVAEHIVESPHTDWWTRDLMRDDQWSISWNDPHILHQEPADASTFQTWRERMRESEARAERKQRENPTASWTNEWWSIPVLTLPRSSGPLVDGSPAGLWFVEDSGNYERATARRYLVPPDACVYEIQQAEDWAELCRRYPIEVTAQKRHDWFDTTGRIGRWVMPDWSMVAKEYDGVHLTAAAYIAAAGTAIPVDDNVASVIAGWDPDTTWWLGDSVEFGESVIWTRNTMVYDSEWIRTG